MAPQKTERKWDGIAQTKQVHAETLAFTEFFNENNGKMIHEMSIMESRQSFDSLLLCKGPYSFDGTESHVTLPADGDTPQGELTVYTSNQTRALPTLLVFLHGGGYIFGSVQGYSRVMQHLAEKTGCIVVGVPYRLLPDSKNKHSPALDCAHAARWIVAHKEAFGGQPGSKVGLIGDSAGGSLTLLVSLDVPGIDFQIAVYPAIYYIEDSTKSLQEMMDVPLFNGKDMDWIAGILSGAGLEHNDPVMVPGYRTDLTSAPPALVVAAGLDPLWDGAVEFAGRLTRAGRSVQLSEYPGLPHGFFGTFDFYPESAGQLFDEIAAYVHAHE